MKKEVILEDDKQTKHVVIRVNLKNNTTSVFSSFSAWKNLALIMEALAVTVQKCIQEGISRKKVYSTIKDYLTKILGNYEILKSSKES